MFFAKFDHLNQCNALRSITFIKYIFLQIAQKFFFHQPLVSETFIKHENDPNLMKIKSPYSNTFGMYRLLPFHSMTVNFDEKHLTFWILGNAFYGTPGIKHKQLTCSQRIAVNTITITMIDVRNELQIEKPFAGPVIIDYCQ